METVTLFMCERLPLPNGGVKVRCNAVRRNFLQREDGTRVEVAPQAVDPQLLARYHQPASLQTLARRFAAMTPRERQMRGYSANDTTAI